MHNSKRFSFYRHCWLALIICLAPSWAAAAEFSATVVQGLHGQERKGQVFVKGDNMRREFPSSGGNIITIYRHGEKVIRMLMPEKKMYFEMPVTDEMTRELMQFSKEQANMKLLGTETVNGYLADKYETSVKNNGGSIKHTMWVARKLGQPIKIVSPDGSFVMEYRNIKEGGVPDAVFNIPPGYQDVGDMPLMMK